MKETIIKETIALFERECIKFTLADIATSLKISKKTIYKYFSSKEALLKECVDHIFDELHSQRGLIIASTEFDLVTKLKKALAVYPVSINFDNFKLNKLIELEPVVHEHILHHYQSDWEDTFSLFDECVNAKLIRDIGKEVFYAIMVGLYENLSNYDNHKEMITTCVDAIFDGFIRR